MIRWTDAHNHLQDPRLGEAGPVIAAMRAAGVAECIVNATGEDDWAAVDALARAYPDMITPAYGIHPWHAHAATGGWVERLAGLLESRPQALLGECGLDQWVAAPPLEVQRELWRLYLAGSAEGSISAMPSMHNGSALLFALASGGWLPWIRRGLWAYVAVIFAGSIHLGYHYAVDSYVAWALALALWWTAEPVARRWEATAVATRFRAAFAESPASL